jgi:periplasmic protein TonB
MSRDDLESDVLEIERPPAMPKGQWILAMCGFGAVLLFGFGLGVSLGQSKTEAKAKPAVEVAQNIVAKPSVVEAAPTKPDVKPEPTKPKVTPIKPKPEPIKPKIEPVKPEPKKPEATSAPVSFATSIAPIFKLKCNGCHGDPTTKGGFNMLTLASISKGGDNGIAVVAKDLDKSYLWSQIEGGAMPPAGKEKLTPAEIKLVKDWILSGAK